MPQARLIPARPWKLVRSKKAEVVVTQEFSLWAIQPQLRFGPSMEFVRLHRQSCQMLLDHIEDDAWWDAMTRLAMCRQDCRIHYNIADKFYEDPKDKWAEQMSDLTWAAASPKATLQPQLKQHRLKAAYVCADTSITSQRTTSPAARSRGLGFGSLSHAEA
ncbi:unnamed protein product [Effrenium voratum]|uniref:Uncharacterized protein n=1 Tax=Effrenium voratum TaxID=2562239 RepID=A0AA36IVT7_9DINO|nr:unnamed protein product [Effrenium voratum]